MAFNSTSQAMLTNSNSIIFSPILVQGTGQAESKDTNSVIQPTSLSPTQTTKDEWKMGVDAQLKANMVGEGAISDQGGMEKTTMNEEGEGFTNPNTGQSDWMGDFSPSSTASGSIVNGKPIDWKLFAGGAVILAGIIYLTSSKGKKNG